MVNQLRIVATFLTLLLLITPARAQEVNFLSMGDWGASGDKQRATAQSMTRYIQSADRKFDALFTAGDNFYVRLDGGIHDPMWKTMFEDMYPRAVFDFPFYVALGNHDYQLDRHMIEFAYGQANPQSRWKMPARYHRVDLPSSDNPLVSVLVLDSNMPLMGQYGWSDQMKWLTAEVAKPRTAKWMLAVAHHPFFSNGDHGDNRTLRNAWGELFEQANLDFYICGHDHDLQHLQVEPHRLTFLLVGGGGAGIRPMRNDKRGPFSKSSYGFADLNFTPTQATVRLIGPDAKVLHAFTRDLAGNINITLQGQADPATPRTVADVTRGGATTAPASQKR